MSQTRIPVVVSDEQKQRWSEQADELNHIDNVSDLIRTAVESYIVQQEHTDQDGNLSDQDVANILDSLERLKADLTTVETELKALRQENPTAEEIVDTWLGPAYDRPEQLVEDLVLDTPAVQNDDEGRR